MAKIKSSRFLKILANNSSSLNKRMRTKNQQQLSNRDHYIVQDCLSIHWIVQSFVRSLYSIVIIIGQNKHEFVRIYRRFNARFVSQWETHTKINQIAMNKSQNSTINCVHFLQSKRRWFAKRIIQLARCCCGCCWFFLFVECVYPWRSRSIQYLDVWRFQWRADYIFGIVFVSMTICYERIFT